ncbi:MAG: hypothetical protein KDJ45_12985 [Hyphomicrobiaceae bacterium]|nr:hypothetical protein [Hyphomicrobiaceae bacterium]
MIPTRLFIAAAAILATTTIAAQAHSTRPIDREMDRQAASIEDGRQSGKITWREGRKLRSEQRKIYRARNRFLADGDLNGREYRRLRSMQKSAAWNIVNEKHDGWRRWKILPRVGR